MDWSYVAGFFDGEGSIVWCRKARSPGYLSPTLIVGQAIQNRAPMDALEIFLKSEMIRFRIGWQNRVLPAHPMLRIRVSHHAHVLVMLMRMLPFLILKRESAERAVAHITSRVWQDAYSEKRYRDAYLIYAENVSRDEVARRVGISSGALCKWWRRLGLHVRPMHCFPEQRYRDAHAVYSRGGISLENAAKQFGMSRTGLRKGLIRLGLYRRARERSQHPAAASAPH